MKITMTTYVELTENMPTQSELLCKAGEQLGELLKGMLNFEDAYSEMIIGVTLSLQDRASSRELVAD